MVNITDIILIHANGIAGSLPIRIRLNTCRCDAVTTFVVPRVPGYMVNA
jgi:hypothetical protein